MRIDYGKLATHVASGLGTLKAYGYENTAAAKSLQYVMDELMASYELAKAPADGKQQGITSISISSTGGYLDSHGRLGYSPDDKVTVAKAPAPEVVATIDNPGNAHARIVRCGDVQALPHGTKLYAATPPDAGSERLVDRLYKALNGLLHAAMYKDHPAESELAKAALAEYDAQHRKEPGNE